MRENKGRVAGGHVSLFLSLGAQGGELVMLKRWRFVIVAVALFSLVLPSAQALEPVKKYQIDVIAIPTALGTPEVTEQMTRAIIEKVNAGFIDATGGLIQFTFRKLYPVPISVSVITSSDQLDKVTGIKPVPDAGFEKAILIGVISKNNSIDFAGQAWGNYMLINGSWGQNSAYVVSHELGHNLGLLHANSAVCTVALPMICSHDEYGDKSSVMGGYGISYVSDPYLARFSAVELDKLGVLADSRKLTAYFSGEYKLSPVYGPSALPILLYVPIAGQNVYAIEYRAATGGDQGLSQSKLRVPNSNEYYSNTPSYGVQLRILNVNSNSYDNLKPISKGFDFFETALVINSVTGQQVNPFIGPQFNPTGKIFTLSDGTTVEIVSQDQVLGATVKIVRPVDTESPKMGKVEIEWFGGDWSYGGDNQRSVPRKNLATLDHPAFEVKAEIADNRAIKSVELEVNGAVVDRKEILFQTKIPVLKYQTNRLGSYAARLIAIDYAGNKTISEVTTLETIPFFFQKSGASVNPGKDPYNSLQIEIYTFEEKLNYELTNLSAGTIGSVVSDSDKTVIEIVGLKDGSKFTATLTGSDERGNTDGGQVVEGETEKLVCTIKNCYVGKTWELDAGYWSKGVGVLTLQQLISGKWKNIKSASPVITADAPKDYPNSYRLSVTYSKPGRYQYRYQIAATKKTGLYTSKSFTQTVTQR